MSKKGIVIREKLEGLYYIEWLIQDMTNALEREKKLYKGFPDVIEQLEIDTSQGIEELEEQKQEALAIIERLDNPLKKRILIELYINGESWDKIAELILYSRVSAFRLHGEALEELQKMIEKT